MCAGVEQGRARGIRGRLYPFISCDSEGDQVTLLGSYSLLLDRVPRLAADMEWDTLHTAPDIELSSNCLTAAKGSSAMPSTLTGTTLYTGEWQEGQHTPQQCWQQGQHTIGTTGEGASTPWRTVWAEHDFGTWGERAG